MASLPAHRSHPLHFRFRQPPVAELAHVFDTGALGDTVLARPGSPRLSLGLVGHVPRAAFVILVPDGVFQQCCDLAPGGALMDALAGAALAIAAGWVELEADWENRVELALAAEVGSGAGSGAG